MVISTAVAGLTPSDASSAPGTVGQRRVEVQHRLAVAEAEIGEEPRIEDAVAPGIRQRRNAVDVKQPVIGDEEALTQQRPERGQGEQQNKNRGSQDDGR